MRKLVAIVVVVAFLAVLVWGSVVRVPEGPGAWCAGRYLAPGWHLRMPFARVAPYEAGERTVRVEREIASREGATYPLTVTVGFRWNGERLATNPIDPERLAGMVGERIAALDGRFSGKGIGPAVREALERDLASLPLELLSVEVSYPGEALDEIAALARPTGAKVVVVGLDGFDWVLLDRLISQGRCSTFARMKRHGAWGDLISHPPVLSPLIWTSIATGRRPEVHGILDFVVKDPKTGKDVPISDQSRKVHTFWNIMSYAGQKVDVANWWATYPAEPVNGVMVSEHLFYQLFGIELDQRDPANVYPPEVLSEVLPLLVPVDDIGYGTIRRFARISRAEYDQALAEAARVKNPYDNRINHLRKIIATTRGVFNVGRWLLEKHPADLVTVYVEGTDTIGHRFAHFLPPKLSWVSDGDFARYHDTMAAYYEEVDRLMGEMMRAAPPDTTWIVTADHGFFTGAARPHVRPDDFGVGASQWHRMVGVFMAMGPHVQRGKLERGVDIYDLCRTFLWLEGDPVSRQLQGRIVTELMRPEWVRDHPPVFVDTYENLPLTWKAEGARSVLDEARVKELEALGYLSPGGGSVARPHGEGGGTDVPATAVPAPAAGDAGVAKVTETYNLAKLADSRGDLEGAERHYLEALRQKPDFAFAMIALADVELRLGKPDEAVRWYTKALETGNPDLPPKVLVDFVGALEKAGRLERAPGALKLLQPVWGDRPGYRAAVGLAEEKLGHLQAAAEAYRAELEADPSNPVATAGMLRLAREGVAVDVDAILRRSFDAVKTDLKKLNDFAVLCLQQGRPDWAGKALEILVRSDPTNAGLLMNLAVARRQEGRMDEARELLERAVRLRPEDASLRYNLGAMLAEAGQFEPALEQLRKARELGLRGARVYAALAKVLFRLGRMDEVRSVLDEGLRENPGNAELEGMRRALGPPGDS